MDGTAFDLLTTTLARDGTRRAALGAFLAAAGTALGLGSDQPATAQGCLPNRERCQTGAECCSGRCVRHNNGKTCRRAENQGVCTIEDDDCGGTFTGCGISGGAGCVCYVTTHGRSFCGDPNAIDLSGCGCTSDGWCEQRFGKGTKCVRNSGGCSCPTTPSDFCVAPCENLNPVP